MGRDSAFRDRTILLTGASSGIGRELALQLAPERPRLALAARDTARLDEVATRCRELGAEVEVMPADVGDQAACRELVERVRERFGAIDVLLLNAGQSMWSRVDELADPAVFEQLMRVNYLGPVWLTYYALADLERSRGRIVVVSSLTALTGVPTRSGYAATKHALHGFFDSLRVELAGSGVTVTLVCPDFVVSEIHRRSIGPDGAPLGHSPMRESKLMTTAACAHAILAAARSRRRLAILSRRGRLGRYARLVAPGWIDRIAARSVARGH